MKSRGRGTAAVLAGLAIAAGLAAIPAASPLPASAAPASTAPPAGGNPQDVGGPELASPGVVVHDPAAGAVPLPRVPASAFVVADAGTGQVLAARDAHGRFPPASTLKMLTAITLIPRLNPGATVRASQQAAQAEPYDVGLIAGRRYKVSDLFKALLLISANDAAVALTQATGSLARGMALINAEAHRLQAYDVVARQPNGLPAAGQVVSAYDEALIARQALAMPAFMKYDGLLAAQFPVKPGLSVPLVNQNRLLTQYRGGIGGKIGWTEAAEATYIGMARRHGVTLIVTVLHCTALQEITAGEQLLNWGFAMDGKVRPVGRLVSPLAAGATGHPARPQDAASVSGSSPDDVPPALAGLAAIVAGLAVSWLLRRRRAAPPAPGGRPSGR